MVAGVGGEVEDGVESLGEGVSAAEVVGCCDSIVVETGRC